MVITLNTTFQRKQKHVIKNIEEGIALWVKHRDEYALGASDMRTNNGDITDNGKVVGHIAYNGRFFKE